MKISIIAGSQRPASQSKKVADYIAGRVPALSDGADTYTLDLGEGPLPFWDQSVWTGDDTPLNNAWKPISAEFAASDGFVIVTPEWHGMVPPALKNLLLLCTSEIAHKPGLIVAVSASMGGAYPVAELRTSGYKNSRIVWVPDHVIVRSVSKVLNAEPSEKPEEDEAIRTRLDYSLKLLFEYAKALRGVRDSGLVDLKAYPFGM